MGGITTFAAARWWRQNRSIPPRWDRRRMKSMMLALAWCEHLGAKACARQLVGEHSRFGHMPPEPIGGCIIGSGRQRARDHGGHIWLAAEVVVRAALTEYGAAPIQPSRQDDVLALAYPRLREAWKSAHAAVRWATTDTVVERYRGDWVTQSIARLDRALEAAEAEGEIEGPNPYVGEALEQDAEAEEASENRD